MKTNVRPIYKIAEEISKDWGYKVNFGAKPYLLAMFELTNISDYYHCDTADMIVRYFLGNASTWRGDVAKRVKIELKAMLK